MFHLDLHFGFISLNCGRSSWKRIGWPLFLLEVLVFRSEEPLKLAFLWLKLFWQNWSFPRGMSLFRKGSLISPPGRQLLAKAAQRCLCPRMVIICLHKYILSPLTCTSCHSEPSTSQTLFAFGSIAAVMALEAGGAGGGRKAEDDRGGRKSCYCSSFLPR